MVTGRLYSYQLYIKYMWVQIALWFKVIDGANISL